MSDLHWQLRTEGPESMRYVSSNDYVIGVSPVPGLVHLLGPVTHHDEEDEIKGAGPRRDLIAVCEIGNWDMLYRWFIEPSAMGLRLGAE